MSAGICTALLLRQKVYLRSQCLHAQLAAHLASIRCLRCLASSMYLPCLTLPPALPESCVYLCICLCSHAAPLLPAVTEGDEEDEQSQEDMLSAGFRGTAAAFQRIPASGNACAASESVESLAPAGADDDVPLRGDTPGLFKQMSAKLGQVRLPWMHGVYTFVLMCRIHMPACVNELNALLISPLVRLAGEVRLSIVLGCFLDA